MRRLTKLKFNLLKWWRELNGWYVFLGICEECHYVIYWAGRGPKSGTTWEEESQRSQDQFDEHVRKHVAAGEGVDDS